MLVLEIAAGRLLAPYVGVSLTTYTGIIGVVLAGIALGAWLGGRAADAFGPGRLIGPTLVAGGLAAMVSVPVVSFVGALELGGGVVAIVVLAALGFVAPATILSAVAPMIVRATIVDVETSGSLVGRLSAIGTVGAITGTFLTGFVLLGLVPTRLLVLGAGGVIVLVGLAVAWRFGRSFGVTVLGVAGGLTLAGSALAAPNPCERESAYYCISVLEDGGGGAGRTLVLDRLFHAHVALDDPSVLAFRYVRWFADASAPVLEDRAGNAAVLHLGGGGFTFPRYLADAHPASRHVVLELDPTVLEVARTELGFERSSATDVVVGDARLSIAGQPTDGFDLVVGDAFASLAVPWHLTTREFLAEVDRVLRPGGRYVMNVIDGPSLLFARAETATLAERFAHVAVVADPSTLRGATGGNVVLVASHAPIDAGDVVRRSEARGERTGVLAGADEIETFSQGAPILRDDFAPVDQLVGR